jgi:hypothetical protein
LLSVLALFLAGRAYWPAAVAFIVAGCIGGRIWQVRHERELRSKRSRMSRCLRITSTPPGEAPLWVREQWVGLELPLVQRNDRPSKHLAFGVLRGPLGCLRLLGDILRGRAVRESGYLVSSHLALDILAKSSPAAASWWRESAPHLLRPGHVFLFHAKSGFVTHAPAE